MSLTGTPIPPLTPGSPEWLRTISASKIPAILGISPWQSKFALWHLMAGNTEPWAGNKTTERGTFLEAAVHNWFVSQHEDLNVYPGASYSHPDHSDWTAAPDGMAEVPPLDGAMHGDLYGIEIKTSQYSDGWGKAGTAEIPPYYLAQVAWQMVVTGMKRVYVPVLFGQPFEFREYVVNYEDVEADIPVIIAAVEDFQESLADGVQPDIDGSSATYQTIRELHPEIDGETVELPDHLAHHYLSSRLSRVMQESDENTHKNRIAEYMGTAKKATWQGTAIFTRQARGTGTPYLVAAKSLPTINEQEKAA